MRILLINDFFYRRGGAEDYLFELMNLLQSQGHEVAVFSMEHPENQLSVWERYFVTTKHPIWNTEAQKKLAALLIEFRPNIAHIHNIDQQLSPAILRTLQRHGVPIVQTLHDYKLLCPNGRLFTQDSVCERCRNGQYYRAMRYRCVQHSRQASAQAALEMYVHKQMKIYEQAVDCFISPSQFLRKKLRDWNIAMRDVRVLPHFIDTKGIIPTYTHQGYLLYLGGWRREKGIDFLLDTLSSIHYATSLHIAGLGNETATVQQLAGNSVTVLGQLSPEQVAKEIAGAMAVIVPSRWYENFSYSVLEAFAHGKPVIAADSGGLPELVIPEVTGWLFKTGNRASLAAVLKDVDKLSNEALAQWGQAARHWVEQQLNPEQHYQTLNEIYSELA